MTHTTPIRCFTLPRCAPARGRVFVLPLRASARLAAGRREAGLSLTWSLDRAAGRLVVRWMPVAGQLGARPAGPERPAGGDVGTGATAMGPAAMPLAA